MARILLVDDDKDIRDLGCALLTKAGHEAFAVEGAVPALEFLRLYSVDILITDANMPQHSGFDLLRTVTKDPQYSREMTLVMLTGRRERKDIERAVELGVHDYIVKPLDPMLFLQKVTDLLERRPPAARPHVDFASLKLNAQAKAHVAIDLISVSELGLIIRSPHRFHEGTRIELETDLFTRMDIVRPMLRVVASVEKDGVWETRIAFVGADERALTKVRAWINSTAARNRSAA